MANEKRLIDANALYAKLGKMAREPYYQHNGEDYYVGIADASGEVAEAPTVDAVEVVRCQNCIHAEPLEHNCVLSTSHYLHCKLWRGEEEKNVWHKYKKYYKDYSLVERDGYCDAGAKE